jgi:hypothetical protein
MTMKFNKTMALAASFIWVLGSISGQEAKTVVNYHTTVERMFNLEDGMTLSQVNQTLGSEPHDLLQNTAGGYMILEYRYLKAHRTVKSSERDTESGRIVGVPHYKDAASVYLMFSNDNRLVSYVTADALGEIEHQYKLEATARRLGAMDAPCTRNCRIAIPGEAVVDAGEDEPEKPVAVEVKEEPSGFAGLFGGVRDKVAAAVTPVQEEEPAPDVPKGIQKDSYEVGEKVWLTVQGESLKGQVVQTMGSRGLRIRYVDPRNGITNVLRSVDDVQARD